MKVRHHSGKRFFAGVRPDFVDIQSATIEQGSGGKHEGSGLTSLTFDRQL